jgi:pimeloyl-ACP methyl ester carboxylesterase
MPKHRIGDVIILLPGILGSVLQREGKDVWAPTPGSLWRGLWSLGRSVKDLNLKDDPVAKDDLGDGVTAPRLVPDVHLVPGVWGIDGYSGITKMILDNFDVELGKTYIEFPYDWRRDNRVAARKLADTAERVLGVARKENPKAKLVLVGHSMGGLVARYYLECMDGWKDSRTLITFGTPYRGSLNTLNFIANGFIKKIGPLRVADLTDLLLSLTSVYQLLPIYKCIEIDGGYVRPAESQGVPRLDTTRATSALDDFHREIEKGVSKRPDNAYEIHPVVGITQPTRQSARLVDGKLELLQTRRNSAGEDVDESGDGTVPRVSATPIELGNKPSAVYASQIHASLQNAESVQTQLLGVLTEVADLENIRDLRSGLSLTLDEVFGPTEQISAQVKVTEPRLELAATVTNIASGAMDGPFPLAARANGLYALKLPPRPAGDYRLSVEGVRRSAQVVQPVTGIFMVAPDAPDESASDGLHAQ